ncbi:MAG: hypothetical protein MZU95_09930 [Desulfomicrobium escambiense]|nr:hypothetical protein [Desulfomicrobium escambiense]
MDIVLLDTATESQPLTFYGIMKIHFPAHVKMKRSPYSDIGFPAAFSGEADHHSPQRLKTGVPLFRAILLTAVLLVTSVPAEAAELSPVSVTILNGEIRAGCSVSPNPPMIEEIREGLSKRVHLLYRPFQGLGHLA